MSVYWYTILLGSGTHGDGELLVSLVILVVVIGLLLACCYRYISVGPMELLVLRTIIYSIFAE